ncbi:glutathione synthase [Gammaproteobacteria bacterium]|jgi:glutathione synthase|nr:glutathione synthase [Pseudomonadota bacterium]MDB0064488.1 glutathione synthase [Gammaproteobacteria bacterium]
MTIKLGIIMDPIESINVQKDSSFAMLLEAQNRAYSSHYIPTGSVHVRNGESHCSAAPVVVQDDNNNWFKLGTWEERALASFDVILMRKDPPFDMEYVYLTYALELAQTAGSLIVNNAHALRNLNEKFSISQFPGICAETLISSNILRLQSFIEEIGSIVVKPLDAMGGASIFRIEQDDPNRNTILEQITDYGRRSIMAQEFIPDISAGDKRILLIDGEPIPYALARIPSASDFRGNLAAGGHAKGIELSESDRHICEVLKPHLRQHGVLFAGIDVIGNYLTEINITSPTCIRQLDRAFDLNISAELFNAIARKLSA